MHYVGVDLAWGGLSPTGVAVLDAHGRLVHLAAVRSDDEILRHIEPYVAGDCVVAFDAPLVVNNPSGNRPCESQLNRDFRRFQAGAHPANTGLAWFADGGRGARLCSTLELDLNPRGRAPRRALEVYPHAASIVLFGLHRTLKYKQKAGRDHGLLSSELLRLMGLIEHLPGLDVADHAAWSELRESVRTSTRKAQLRRAEDPVDAVLCAYLAKFASERPSETTVYGDPATGQICTPTLGLRQARTDAGEL